MRYQKIIFAIFFLLITCFSVAQTISNHQGNIFKAVKQIKDIHPLYTPYVDCCLWPPFDIGNVDSTGICLYTMAFIVDDQFEEGANPCWGGFGTYDMTWYQEQIAELREKGGEVIISFGGANGFPLAFVASDEFELKDAFKLVVDSYDLQSVDFDIEGMFVAHPESIERRSAAMKLLQDEYPDLQISLTLPVMPWGLTADGVNVVTNAVDHDVDLSVVNIMAMDYGGPGDMGDNAISAMENTFSQLKTIYEEAGIPKPDSAVWAMIGVTPMVGQNDVMEEIFYLDDAEDVRDFAFEKNIGRIAIWSANRDRQCENSWDPLYICSHIEQTDFEFSYIFQQNGTISFCSTVSVDNRPVSSSSVEIYPNPAGDYLFITGGADTEITVTGIDGVTISKIKINSANFRLDISGLVSGTYLMVFKMHNTINYRKLVIVK